MSGLPWASKLSATVSGICLGYVGLYGCRVSGRNIYGLLVYGWYV